MPRSIDMTVALSPGEVRARLADAIDQSLLSRFLALHVGRLRFVGRVRDSSFRFAPTMHLFLAIPGPVCTGEFVPSGQTTRLRARIRRHWCLRLILLVFGLVFVTTAAAVVSDAVRRGEDWWLGVLPCAYVLVVMVVMYLVTKWRDAELERRTCVFLSGLFEEDVVSSG